MIDRLKNVYEYSVGKDSAFLVFEGTLALLAADGFRRNKLFPALLGSAAVAAVILWALGRYTATGLVLTVALVCAGLYGLFSGKAERSALLLAGLASVGDACVFGHFRIQEYSSRTAHFHRGLGGCALRGVGAEAYRGRVGRLRARYGFVPAGAFRVRRKSEDNKRKSVGARKRDGRFLLQHRPSTRNIPTTSSSATETATAPRIARSTGFGTA